MGLKEQIQNSVTVAFKALGNVPARIEYLSYEDSVFATATGAQTSRFASQKNVQVLFENYSRREIDGENIQAEDQKVSIPNAHLGFTPKPKDRIKRKEGEIWRVVDYDPSTDPAEAMYVLQCRRIK